jgi:hypothetical protein
LHTSLGLWSLLPSKPTTFSQVFLILLHSDIDFNASFFNI